MTENNNILFKNTPAPIFRINSKGLIVEANDYFFEVSGLDTGILGNFRCFDIIKCQSGECFDILKAVGTIDNYETILNNIPVVANCFADYDDEGIFCGATVFLKLVEPKQPDYKIFSKTSVPIYIYDPETREIVDVNSACCAYYGYSISEFLSLSVDDINDADYDSVTLNIKSIIEGNGESKFLFRHILKDGGIRFIETRPTPINIEGRQLIFEPVHDITDKYKSERNLNNIANLSTLLMNSDIDLNKISEVIVSYAKEFTGATAGYAGSIDEDSGNLCIHSYDATGFSRDDKYNGKNVELHVGPEGIYEGLWGHTLNTKEFYFTNSVESSYGSPDEPEAYAELDNFLSCPVIFDGEVVGQISVANSPKGFDEKDVHSLSELVKLYAFALTHRSERQFERLFRTMFDHIEDGVAILVMVDGEYILKEMNQSGLDISGLKRENVVGRNLTDVYPGFEGDPLLKTLNEVWENGEAMQHPMTMYKDENHELWIEAYVFKLDNKYLVTIFRDITEVVNKTQELQASEEKYRTYINDSPDPIIVVDEFANVVESNKAAYEKFGYSEDELIGNPVSILWPESERDRFLNDMFKLEAYDKIKIVHEFVSKSGDLFDIQVHIKALGCGHYMGILQDITDRIKMQKELSELNVDLQKRVQQEVQLREKQERAFFEQKKLADMGQMVNAIAHQWRQPINALGLSAQYISEQYVEDKLNDDDISEFKSMSTDLIQHMSRTIDDFRNFCSPDKAEVDYEVIYEIRSTLKVLESQLGMDGISCNLTCTCPHKDVHLVVGDNFKCEHGLSKVCGYPGELKQAFMNIISNAVDSIKDRIAIDGSLKGRLDIAVNADKEGVSILCCDNGGGIPEDVMPNIFDPYFTTKDEGKGTGIGLYMTKLVVEKHMNGRVHAFNNKDGACFEIYLPKNL